MANALQTNPAYLFFAALAAAINIFAPLVIALAARRALNLSWKYIGFGALIFLVFQLLTRIPVMFAIQAAIAPQLKASRELTLAWGAGVSFTAGLFEEVGRWVGYRFLMRNDDKTWGKGVLYGIGHGGLEAALFVGGLGLITVVNLAALPMLDLSAQLTPEQMQTATQQIAAINALPAWMPLLGVWERIWAMCFHVAASLIVMRCFTRGHMVWLAVAIAFHTVLNLTTLLPAALGVQGISGALLTEGVLTVFGLFSLWLIWKMKEEK
ncbi:MAG TPA: YhfC family glutamic-type intramembrane protease [Thermoflexales bacterium]|nr:YhfC family glutamic-type intramembrane protease [Thermoflexales bacterium]HQW34410.1 YhfC family glutamic-type intramembrane protease [Thermoflexales bacterium]HQZ99244.1 YhfC family glutamic-type intramembrane protease [Thermoflexales bacterium]